MSVSVAAGQAWPVHAGAALYLSTRVLDGEWVPRRPGAAYGPRRRSRRSSWGEFDAAVGASRPRGHRRPGPQHRDRGAGTGQRQRLAENASSGYHLRQPCCRGGDRHVPTDIHVVASADGVPGRCSGTLRGGGGNFGVVELVPPAGCTRFWNPYRRSPGMLIYQHADGRRRPSRFYRAVHGDRSRRGRRRLAFVTRPPVDFRARAGARTSRGWTSSFSLRRACPRRGCQVACSLGEECRAPA